MNIPRLVKSKELKFNLFHQFLRTLHFVKYSENLDYLFVRFAKPREGIVVHYLLDDYIALVYEEKTKEVIGIQIEDFQQGFLKKYRVFKFLWMLIGAPKVED